jgi:lipid II:glycine glycyltransferase (peptidoglycan interpeptide bridge formation enzyme)
MAFVELRPAELAVCSGASSFLQSDFWGNFKARFGWKALAFSADWETAAGSAVLQKQTAALPLLVLYRRLGPGIGFAYIPWGPELPPDYNDAARITAAAETAATLRAFLPKDTAFIRFDFPWFTEGLSFKPFIRAAADVQPPDTVLVDLVPNETAILGSMKSKWRYNIGLAGKKGVAVRSVPASPAAGGTSVAADMAAFYRLYRETAVRDGISIHNIEYYQALFDEAAKHGVTVRLYMASHEGEDIAGIVTLFRGREAVYLYGASSNHKRNLMAPYALQWQAMRDAKAVGCHYYDMFGIPPRPPEEAPDHPMAGLYRFKTGFIGDGAAGSAGGRIVHRPGSWDYRCRPLVSALYSAAEKTRKKIWDIKKKLKKRSNSALSFLKCF